MTTQTITPIERNAQFPLLTIPGNNLAKMQEVVVAIQKWGRSLRASYEAVEPTGKRDNQEHWTALKKVDDDLKKRTENLVDDVSVSTGIKAILIQLAAERKAFKALYAEKWAKFVELRDAGKPAERVHRFCFVLDATDSQYDKISTAISKAGVTRGEAHTVDDAKSAEAVNKLFEKLRENEAKAAQAMGGL